ncbi:39S ribosomal protein L40, mitochondrial-like [Myxocyprinus asiaticus]|uniref:39S ribosomal protein L40, mitochondrial-like n=1 Tax=Myxocyprinus asiaticus TaxID=70543 RepID=UPI002223BE83|nr:39S ribosomal protein L40, mitochondrial-like [Myxocyprinus asiaticus]
MAGIVCRTVSRIISSQTQSSCCSSVVAVRHSHWFTSVLPLKTSMPLRAEPKKKKKTDPRREQMMKERLKKKLKKLEKVPPELIPVEDFVTPAKCFDETRIREAPKLSFEESERRALLLKKWSRYKHIQHQAEMATIKDALEAQRQALEELKLESEELYKAAIRPDTDMFPLQKQGPCYTPPVENYEAPGGKYTDTTRVYTQ